MNDLLLSKEQLSIVIIDDEKSGRSIVKSVVKKHFPHYQILGEAESVKSGVELIKSSKPNIVLLDVEMRDGTGFDLLREIPNPEFRLIFITAHEKYAIKAFKYSAIDYLLKPVENDQLVEAINKCAKEFENKEIKSQLDVLFSNKKQFKKLAIPTVKSIEIVLLDDIIRLEAYGNYSQIFLKDSKIVSSKTLKEYDQILSGTHFFRVHKSHLVNLNKIVRYVQEDGGYIITTDGAEVEIARRRKELFLSTLMDS